MLPTNAALIIAGPALVIRGGQTFYSKGNITINPKLDTFEVASSRFGKVDERESTFTLEAKFTPVGAITAGLLAALYPYGATIPGTFVHMVDTVETVTAATDQLMMTAHGFRNGHGVRVVSGNGTLPTGLVAATTYFAHKVDVNNITLHLTEAAAIAGTAAVDITALGTGTVKVIEQEYLAIHSFDGIKYTFHNAALVSSPDFNGQATDTAFGEVTFEIFRKHATDATDAAAFYTSSVIANTDATFDPTQIITQPYSMVWGAVAPWNSMTTKKGVKLSFPLTLEAVQDDAGGILTRKITGLAATATAAPNNVSESDVFSALTMQGAGAGRGRRMAGSRLDITGTGMFATIYGAALKTAPLNWDSKEDRIGDLQWSALRSFAAGVPNPLYALSTAVIP